jgi:hypothetical protein
MMINKTQTRHTHTNGMHAAGTFCDYVTFTFPPTSLNLVDIDQGNERLKLRDIAHYRFVKAQERGEAAPVIVTFALLQPDQPVEQLFPGLSFVAENGERLLSANSFITYTMRVLFQRGWITYEDTVWQIAVPSVEQIWQRRATAVLRLLTAKKHLYLESARGSCLDFAQVGMDIDQDLVPVAGCGFLSDFDRREQPDLVFNSAYFLLEHDDIFNRHSALCEAHSFWMTDGIIYRPPLFRRGTIWQRAGGDWEVGLLGMDDLRLILPNGLRLVHWKRTCSTDDLSFTLNDEGPSDVTLYTRYYGVAGQGRVLGCTPIEPGRFELTVIDRRIVSWKVGGGLTLPHNGLVISFAAHGLSPAAMRELTATLGHHIWLDYQFVGKKHQAIRQGLQAGPILLQDGRSPLTNTYLEEGEQFWSSRTLADGRRQIGVVPTKYKIDVDQTRAGRVGIGITQDGRLVMVLAAGVNDGMGLPGLDSFGATLAELAEALRQAGAVSAVNLDGGGSTQAYFQGEQAIVPGDRRGVMQRSYERMVPSVGIVK